MAMQGKIDWQGLGDESDFGVYREGELNGGPIFRILARVQIRGASITSSRSICPKLAAEAR